MLAIIGQTVVSGNFQKGGWGCSTFKTDTETQPKRELRHLYLALQLHVF